MTRAVAAFVGIRVSTEHLDVSGGMNGTLLVEG